jgi:hypothetical protein
MSSDNLNDPKTSGDFENWHNNRYGNKYHLCSYLPTIKFNIWIGHELLLIFGLVGYINGETKALVKTDIKYSDNATRTGKKFLRSRKC